MIAVLVDWAAFGFAWAAHVAAYPLFVYYAWLCAPAMDDFEDWIEVQTERAQTIGVTRNSPAQLTA